MGRLTGACMLLALAGCCLAGDMMRKSIVYNPKTPDVFYCPLYKPKSFDDMLVKSRPLSKLCEFKGRPLPADYKSDCYGDVDETEFACAEKHRILMRRNPPGAENAIDVEDEFVYSYYGYNSL